MCEWGNKEDEETVSDDVEHVEETKVEGRKISYSVADKTLLIIDAEMPWVAEYDECLSDVTALATEKGCGTLACFFERNATEYFLKKKGWETVQPGIMEYVLK